MADQRTSCHPSVQLTIICYQKLLIPPQRAISLLTFYAEYFFEIEDLVMNEREVVVYFQAAFERH